MEEKREEDFDQEFDDEELDLTKDAFFSDFFVAIILVFNYLGNLISIKIGIPC